MEARRGDCPCPGAVHAVETIDIMAELDLPTAAGAMAAVKEAPPETSAVQAALISAYLPAVIRRWSFMEPDGTGGIHGVPITRANMERLLPWGKGGMVLADRCDTLYSEGLLAPLVALTSISSQDGQTADSTSVIPSSGLPPQTHSGPSLPTSTDGTEYAVPA